MGVKMTGLRETQQGLSGFAAKARERAMPAVRDGNIIKAPMRKRRSRQAIANHIRRVMRMVMEQQNGSADFGWIVRLIQCGCKHGC